MSPRRKLSIILITASCLLCLPSMITAQAPEAGSDDTAVPEFPYFASITADDVYIRSGPGDNYYPCGKLAKDDKVKIVGRKHSWSHIVPPPGSFSWISKKYVEIDKDNPGMGIVTGDSVRVYAGSDFKEPMHSESLQLKLNTDDKVMLLGEEKDGYYKIKPPTGAYLWVFTKYTQPIETTAVLPEPEIPPAEPENITESDNTTSVVPTMLTDEAKQLQKYYELDKQIKSEKARPISEQNYSNIKKQLLEIVEDKQAGKAARYSQYMLKQVNRYELVAEVEKQLRAQQEQLQQASQRIDKAHTKKLDEFKGLGRFIVIGRLESSIIFGPERHLRRYRIVDNEDKILCYAEPTGVAENMDLSSLVGKRVGLIGTIEAHPQIKGALARFNQIEQLN